MYVHEILESMGQSPTSPPITARDIVVTIDDTIWTVEIPDDSHRLSRRSDTASALCEAWAAQLGGRVVFSNTTTVLHVPRGPESAEQSRPEGK